MLKLLRQKRAQSTVEYAVLIVIVIAALLTIQNYIKRGVQGRLKSSADDIGDQYSEGNTNVMERTKSSSKVIDTFGIGGQGISRSEIRAGGETTNTEKRSVVINDVQEYWGGGTQGGS